MPSSRSPERARSFYKPTLDLHDLGDGESFAIGAIPVTAFAQSHGFSITVGYRFGNAAYTTDVVELGEAAFAILEGVDTWIIGTPVARPHPTHCHVGRALEWIAEDPSAPSRPQPPRQRPRLCRSGGRASAGGRAGIRRVVPRCGKRTRERTKQDQRKLNTGMGRRGLNVQRDQ